MSPSPRQRYGVALASVLMATLVRLLLDPVLGPRYPYPTFFVALVLNAWYGGLGPAVLVMLLSAASATFFFVAPTHSFAIGGADNLMGLGLFFFVGLISALLSESLHAAERREEANAREAQTQQQAWEREARARQRAEETQRFLAEASIVLASSLDYQSTLDHVTKLAIPRFGDWCMVHLAARDSSSAPEMAACAHADPAQRELLDELLQRYPPPPDTAHGYPLVLRTGQAELLPEIPEALLAAAAVDAEHLRLLRALGLKSHLCVPLIARGEILGVLSLVSAESGRVYSPADLGLAEELARRAATAIDNACLYQEARAAQAALGERAEALLEADRKKDQFLAMLGHELRTPLSAVRTTLEVLQRQSASRRELAPLCERVERQTRRMARLIDDLQDVTRIAQGKLLLRRERVDLRHLVQETAEDERAALEAHHLTLTLDLPAEPVWLEGDPTRLAQVLVNLLNNATKFTDPGGRVTLALGLAEGFELPQRHRDTERRGDGTTGGQGEPAESESSPRPVPPSPAPAPQVPGPISPSSSVSLCLCGNSRSAVITVRDTGIGIEPALLPHLFDSFTQAAVSLDRSRGGLGLGLALVKGLVELHRGEVRISSAGPGCGTEVCVWLPCLALGPQPAPTSSDRTDAEQQTVSDRI